MKSSSALPIFLSLITCLLLFIFLWWHWDLGMNRYFDVDEFAHLGWTARWMSGKRPYIDFLTFFPPGYMLVLAPLLKAGWGTSLPLVAGRMLSFTVFTLTSLAASILFIKLRGKSWVALLVALIVSFLPLPFDKYLEIRPDTLATLFLIIGMVLQITYMRQTVWLAGVGSGFFYFTSLLVLTKGLPAVAVAGFVYVLWGASRLGGMKRIKPVFVGFGIPSILFSLWVLSLGDVSRVVYSLAQLPLEANKISKWFIMMPDLFFYPNNIFYGQGGWSRGLVINHMVWVVGILVGLHRLLLPYLSDRNRIWEEFLVAGVFFVHVYFFVIAAPLKHAQYLIPIGFFIAFYLADLVGILWNRMKHHQITGYIFVGFYSVILLYLYHTFVMVNAPKRSWTNLQALANLNEILTSVPKSESIVDLDGRTMYYPDPYMACCIPFGQFSEFLSRPLPSLSSALEATQVKYIYQGELERVGTLRWEDQQYIRDRYMPWNGRKEILIRK